MSLVPSASNKADALIHVPQRWLTVPAANPTALCMDMEEESTKDVMQWIHNTVGHLGIRHTLYFAKRASAAVTKWQVRAAIADCYECQSVDPTPVKWKKGNFEVKEGERVAMDITYHGGRFYLTLIDCGLRFQTTTRVVQQLEDSLFFGPGAPEELLTNNDTAFRPIC